MYVVACVLYIGMSCGVMCDVTIIVKMSSLLVTMDIETMILCTLVCIDCSIVLLHFSA